jgi:hypothetical protein
MSDQASLPEMPLHVGQLFAELTACREAECIGLVTRGTFQVWTRHYRDRGMNWQPMPKAKNHSFSSGVWLFDHGLVRMVGKRMVLLSPSSAVGRSPAA